MSGFSADWLALREPYDLAARAQAAAALDLGGMARRMRRDANALEVLDLACGTGANLRALAPRLGGAQRWLLVDHDAQLLAALPRVFAAWAQAEGLALREDAECLRIEAAAWDAEVRWRRIDLASALDAVPFGDAQLVTAAALLDLVSASWLDALLERVRRTDAAMFFALSVDGRVRWMPPIEEDEAVLRLFAAHQRRDKGFGPALGGEAPAIAAARLRAMGYRVMQSCSDWHIDGLAMLRAMAEGMAGAAREQDPGARRLVRAWREHRLALAPHSCLDLGHMDLLALPG